MSKNIEYEGKILNINPAEIRQRLISLGAKKIADYEFKRYVFDTIPFSEGRWVRLRSDGTKTTLAVKEIESNEIDGTSEWEVEVSDLNHTLTILEKIGLEVRGYQENLREEYQIGESTVCIDSWPMLNPYIEIEGVNKKEVEKLSEELGYAKENIVADNTKVLYAKIGVDINAVKEIKFNK
jgi:adenylate cyclase class 2